LPKGEEGTRKSTPRNTAGQGERTDKTSSFKKGEKIDNRGSNKSKKKNHHTKKTHSKAKGGGEKQKGRILGKNHCHMAS